MECFEIVTEHDDDALLGQDGTYHLILEYVEHDLTGILDMMKTKKLKPFSIEHVRTLTQQLLSALAFLHERNIIHRDLKCSNLLMTNDHILKLADFGLAICEEPVKHPLRKRLNLTNKVITLWYRPVELFLGETKYHTEVDIWSAGCIVAELLAIRPLFNKKTDQEMVLSIFKVCGTPTMKDWPGHTKLKYWSHFAKHVAVKPKLKETIMSYGTHLQAFDKNELYEAFRLLSDMLQMNPARRIKASYALQHTFLHRCILPMELEPITSDRGAKYGYHEFQTKEMRRKEREEYKKKRGITTRSGASNSSVKQERRRREDVIKTEFDAQSKRKKPRIASVPPEEKFNAKPLSLDLLKTPE